MDILKKLLKLDLIGWLLIALSVLNVLPSDVALKLGVTIILISKVLCALGKDCYSCNKGCKIKE